MAVAGFPDQSGQEGQGLCPWTSQKAEPLES